jgi:hypothetical protein
LKLVKGKVRPREEKDDGREDEQEGEQRERDDHEDGHRAGARTRAGRNSKEEKTRAIRGDGDDRDAA